MYSLDFKYSCYLIEPTFPWTYHLVIYIYNSSRVLIIPP